MNGNPTIRLGTRGSLLAKAQSQLVANELMRAHHGVSVELVTISTSGDRIQDRPLYEEGGKGLFTKELELALLNREIDFAVHSFKDVPVTMPLVDQSDLIIAAVPKREDARDVAVMFDPSKGVLPDRAKVGTSSLRRKCQILEAAPHAQIVPVRGNIDTRIGKLREGQFDIVILAIAGLKRAGLYDPSFMRPIDILPAAGQGALAIQCRRDNQNVREIVQTFHDPQTAECVDAERMVVKLLNGDCHSPIAAHAAVVPAGLLLRAAVGQRDGAPPVRRAEATVERGKGVKAAEDVVKSLLK